MAEPVDEMHRAWIARQRLDDGSRTRRCARCSCTSTGLTASSTRSTASWSRSLAASGGLQIVEILARFHGIATGTALGLIAEIGDFHRFSHPRELCAWLGIVPSEYSCGDQRHRGHITKTGNHHARRLLIEAAWSYQHRPRRPDRGPNPTRAPGKPRSGCTAATTTSSPIAENAPPSRPSPSHANSPGSSGPPPPTNLTWRPPPDLSTLSTCWGPATAATSRRTLDPSMRSRLATLVRGSSRPDTVLRSRPAHLRVTVVVAAATVAGPQHPTTTMTNKFRHPPDTRVHLR